MGDPLALVPERQRGLLRPAAVPDRPQAMTATLTTSYFSDPRWLYERKLDGQRVLAVRAGGAARLVSRTGRDLTATYPELAEAVAARGAADLAADGEVVAFEGGRTSFARLQQRIGLTSARRARASGVAVYYYLFDLTYLDGYDLTRLPLRTRKSLLRVALDWGTPLRYTQHRNADGEAYFATACERGWEGVIAKRGDSGYRAKRSHDWLKFKCVTGQELVIGGFTPPRGARTGFGALLVGYYDAGRLRYAGKVGTGFDDRTLRRLRAGLDAIARATSPFDTEVGEREAHWVRPELVAEVGFTEWTVDGKLRHPRFQGLRDDKAAHDVVREDPRPGTDSSGGR
ncbi:bifunctional non-homologous end joining protein LigD [Murinocardiopsis flavida]|uniref:DNA ligase (ATP) n=1 Tax=Murinocardiopsis flavida TaxID=645275 RepID=A0A2P8DTR5_9ACTN|nr:non-homologous end-joining DNA ligase [Murinocardiopsis flavida]PSL00593.1 bifunctional non-homologous end joining protein LigD [Murinocardiopsis flavida]